MYTARNSSEELLLENILQDLWDRDDLTDEQADRLSYLDDGYQGGADVLDAARGLYREVVGTSPGGAS